MLPTSLSPTDTPAGLAFGQTVTPSRRFKSFRIVRIAAIWEAFFVALRSLRQNKLRTGLTLIGIIVGVTAVIAVVTIIKGLDQTVAQTFSSQGSTVFTVSKRRKSSPRAKTSSNSISVRPSHRRTPRPSCGCVPLAGAPAWP